MSCNNNNCSNSSCSGGCSSSSSSNTCVSQLSLGITPNSCTLCGNLNGVPIVPVDLGPAIKHCETDTQLRLDTDTCSLRYEGEDYPETGVADVISVCTMLGCASLSCLGDVSNATAEQCDLLVWDDTDHQWEPYTIPDGVIDDLVGVTDTGCLVKSSDISCTIGQQLSTEAIDNFVGIDSNGCLAINDGGAVLGSCQIGPTVITGNLVNGEAAMPADSTRDLGVIATIPARDCPVRVLIWCSSANNLLPHLSAGQGWHFFYQFGLDGYASFFTETNAWHDWGTTGGSWSSGSVCAYPAVLNLPAGGPNDIYVRFGNDLNPAVAPTIPNIDGHSHILMLVLAQ